MINFLVYQAFLLYLHYMRENVCGSIFDLGLALDLANQMQAERRLYTLRDQLKVQFRATQQAQVNERKAANSKRRLTS